MNPGQPIRFAVHEEGRFEPASREAWMKTYTIKANPPAIDVDDSVLNPENPQGSINEMPNDIDIDKEVAMVPMKYGSFVSLANLGTGSQYDPLIRADKMSTAGKPKGDWFASPGPVDISSLFFCPVHKTYEDKASALRDIRSLVKAEGASALN